MGAFPVRDTGCAESGCSVQARLDGLARKTVIPRTKGLNVIIIG